MKVIFFAAALALIALVSQQASAHEGEDHHCKKGYVMTDDHRCVKK